MIMKRRFQVVDDLEFQKSQVQPRINPGSPFGSNITHSDLDPPAFKSISKTI